MFARRNSGWKSQDAVVRDERSVRVASLDPGTAFPALLRLTGCACLLLAVLIAPFPTLAQSSTAAPNVFDEAIGRVRDQSALFITLTVVAVVSFSAFIWLSRRKEGEDYASTPSAPQQYDLQEYGPWGRPQDASARGNSEEYRGYPFRQAASSPPPPAPTAPVASDPDDPGPSTPVAEVARVAYPAPPPQPDPMPSPLPQVYSYVPVEAPPPTSPPVEPPFAGVVSEPEVHTPSSTPYIFSNGQPTAGDTGSSNSLNSSTEEGTIYVTADDDRTIDEGSPTLTVLPGYFEIITSDDPVRDPVGGRKRLYSLSHNPEFGIARPTNDQELIANFIPLHSKRVSRSASKQGKVVHDFRTGKYTLVNHADPKHPDPKQRCNPIRLEGRPLRPEEEVELKEGDRVQVGDIMLRFHIEGRAGNLGYALAQAGGVTHGQAGMRYSSEES